MLGFDVKKSLKAIKSLNKFDEKVNLVVTVVEGLYRTHHNKNLNLLNFWELILSQAGENIQISSSKT